MSILNDKSGYVYMLHFERPIAPGRHTCQHYIGYAADLARRLEEHAAGHGARLTQVALARGIGWRLVRLWRGDRNTERRIKRGKNGRTLCPICGGRSIHYADEISPARINEQLLAA